MGEQSREARPEGCVVVAARVRERCALVSGVCGVTQLSSRWGGTRSRVFVGGEALAGGGGGAAAGPSCSGSTGAGTS